MFTWFQSEISVVRIMKVISEISLFSYLPPIIVAARGVELTCLIK